MLKNFYIEDFDDNNRINVEIIPSKNYKRVEFIDRVDLIYENYQEDKIDIWKKILIIASKILFGIYSIVGIKSF